MGGNFSQPRRRACDASRAPATAAFRLAPVTTIIDSAHACAAPACLQALEVDQAVGLNADEARRRLAQHGPNRLPEAPPAAPLALFIGQFRSLIVLLLFAAAGLALALGDVKNAIAIFVVLLLNALLGFYQEWRAERSVQALRHMLSAQARVRRGGRALRVDSAAVAPGDIVLLEAGERVPADGRLIEAAALEVDESSLTGESVPVAKDSTVVLDAAAPLAERSNSAFMNTLVTRGRGVLLVTATGAATEIGRLSVQLAAATAGTTPLQRQLDALGRRLAAIALAMIAALGAFELGRGTAFVHVAVDSIALAVASMPEGLPAVVTVTLALGMRRMARRQAIVKRLASVETLGSTTVICTDKTGTLTLNEMTVRAVHSGREVWRVGGQGYDFAGRVAAGSHGKNMNDGGNGNGKGNGNGNDSGTAAVLREIALVAVACNDSDVHDGKAVGDPTEAALIVLAAKAGVHRADAPPRIAEVPFDSAHKYMATLHADDGGVRMLVKGAPDVLLPRCAGSRALGDGDDWRDTVTMALRELTAQGLRVLLLADRTLPRAAIDTTRHDDLVHDLRFLALVGMVDPPRPEAREAIALCQGAGVQVKMITGDHQDTALAIARDLGIPGRALSGRELSAMSPAELRERIDDTGVFARVTPQHKVAIVKAHQARGHVVAMTGDGVNDAPALKSADIGVAMGIAGTAVAQEAATMVLADDRFSTIAHAVEEGRRLYDNIVKFVRFQLTTTLAAVSTVFLAPLLGLPEPFTAVRILWVALIMDGPPAVALSMDAARPGLMNEPPRRADEPLLHWRRIGKVLALAGTMTAGTLGVLWWSRPTLGAPAATTLAFTTFVLFQVFNVFNARAERGSAFNAQFFRNRLLWAALAAVIGLQVIAVQWPPAHGLFDTVPMAAGSWLLSVAVASSVLLLEEARKCLRRLAGVGSAAR
jgi:P-type Ca2+ transporter type 2C